MSSDAASVSPTGARDAATFVFSRRLFLSLLGFVYLIAFASLGTQITGLVGSHGILPVDQYLAQARVALGAEAYRILPTLLWLSTSDLTLQCLCWGGAALALPLIAGLAPAPMCALLWLMYLSLSVAGQVFLEFQWDTLLLETGLLACLYAPLRSAAAEPNPVVRWVVWGLAFKLTFLSGITKLLSGDSTWSGWTAMTYHYWTQPLPTWTSWYAAHLPIALHRWTVPLMLSIELCAPLVIALPSRFRRIRLIACVLMILLQVGIGLTGNYGFFNLLSVVLYLTLLDDRTLRGRQVSAPRLGMPPREPRVWTVATAALAVAIAGLSVVAFVREIQITAGTKAQITRDWPGRILDWASPLRSVNGYGLFRVMTTTRAEIVIEVSDDGVDFKEYEFRWKPGAPGRRPTFVEPHMPRLDWQMWFAALDPPSARDWLESLRQRILDAEPAVARLLGQSPLRTRPRFVRFGYWEYRFSTQPEHAQNGAWWTRTFRGYLN